MDWVRNMKLSVVAAGKEELIPSRDLWAPCHPLPLSSASQPFAMQLVSSESSLHLSVPAISHEIDTFFTFSAHFSAPAVFSAMM